MKCFRQSKGIKVPRSRFLPVKRTSDLFLIMSNLYELQNGILQMSPERLFQTTPVVKLGDENFMKVSKRIIQHIFKTVYKFSRTFQITTITKKFLYIIGTGLFKTISNNTRHTAIRSSHGVRRCILWKRSITEGNCNYHSQSWRQN